MQTFRPSLRLAWWKMTIRRQDSAHIFSVAESFSNYSQDQDPMSSFVIGTKITVLWCTKCYYHDSHNDDDDGYPAYSHHDRFPPWWVFVRDDNGGNLSGDKIPPLMMIMIMHNATWNLFIEEEEKTTNWHHSDIGQKSNDTRHPYDWWLDFSERCNAWFW